MSDTSAGAPLGAEVVTTSQETSTSPGSPTNTAPAEPTVLELTPDSLIKGPDGKPVKYNDYLNSQVRGFQATATKASQRAAELERRLQEREAAIQRAEQERQRASRQGDPSQNPLAGLETLPYLTGQDAAAVVRSIGAEFQTRDQVLYEFAKQLKAIQEVVKPMYESTQTTAFESKIAGFLKEGNHPEEYKDLASELYLGYEPGPDLDREFPRILSERISQVEAALDRKRKAAAESARRAPFVPGKGGVGTPSRPLQLAPNRSAAQEAAELWEQIQIGPGS